MSSETPKPTLGQGQVVIRHKLPDRWLHWFNAICIMVLLGTGLLPVVGINFEWVTIHWIAGIIMMLLLLVHICRVIPRGRLLNIWFGVKDLKIVRAYIGGGSLKVLKPSKYSPAQKLMHQGVTFLVLVTIVTGLLMMVKIDTPLWERNIYIFEDQTWGVIYFLHGFAALFLVTTVMLHIYFSLRPEKWMYLRSMLKGWITDKELERHHDKKEWAGD